MGAGGAPSHPTTRADVTVALSRLIGSAARELGRSVQGAECRRPVSRPSEELGQAALLAQTPPRRRPSSAQHCPGHPCPEPHSLLRPHGLSLHQLSPFLPQSLTHCSFLTVPTRLSPAHILGAHSDATPSERPSLSPCSQVPAPHCCLLRWLPQRPLRLHRGDEGGGEPSYGLKNRLPASARRNQEVHQPTRQHLRRPLSLRGSRVGVERPWQAEVAGGCSTHLRQPQDLTVLHPIPQPGKREAPRDSEGPSVAAEGPDEPPFPP